MKTKNQGFEQGCRGVGLQNPHTLKLGLNRQSLCISPDVDKINPVI